MNYLDLEYAKRQYLAVLYELIISDIQNNVKHGLIVRQLIKNGVNLKAENLYQYVPHWCERHARTHKNDTN